MNKDELIARESLVGRTCAGPMKAGAREAINALLEEGKEEEAKVLNLSSRKRCGQDLNPIFLAELDGKEHDYTCPQCGVKGKYTAAGPADSEQE